MKIVRIVVKWSGLLIRIIFRKWLVVCYVSARLHYWFSSSLIKLYMFLNNDNTLLDSSKGWWSHNSINALIKCLCLYLDIFLKKTNWVCIVAPVRLSVTARNSLGRLKTETWSYFQSDVTVENFFWKWNCFGKIFFLYKF